MSTPVKFWPDTSKADPQVHMAVTIAQNAINQHDQAIVLLNTKIAAIQTAQTTASTSVTENITQNTVSAFPGLGTVNNQTGATTYLTQSTDNGTLIVFNDSAAITVSLNSAILPPFLTFITNLGTGTITLTPTTGAVNGLASVRQNFTTIVVFDGTNWWATELPVVAQTFNAVAHEFLNSYNASTGAFTAPTSPARSRRHSFPRRELAARFLLRNLRRAAQMGASRSLTV
jgi:hypothetical protein